MGLYMVRLKHHTHKTSRKASAAEHTAYIVRDRTTPETQAYVDYVLRQSRTSKDREDLAHAAWHNLPAWANDNPVQFFLAAERYEGANRRVSSSLEIALPRELPREAQIALMQDYCASQFGQHVYVMGLHDSIGASGEPNPHFHVTWSARKVDGIERPAAEYFRRPPHGAGKEALFRKPGWLEATRQAWSDLANVSLEQHGITGAFVDPRSLATRGIDRAPERRLNPSHTTRAKLGKGSTDDWQKVLDGRRTAAERQQEQTLADAAWIVRKVELGITDVQAVDRAAFVEQIASQTRTQAVQKTPRQKAEDLEAERTRLEAHIQTLEDALDGVQVPMGRLMAALAASHEDSPRGGGLRMSLRPEEESYGR